MQWHCARHCWCPSMTCSRVVREFLNPLVSRSGLDRCLRRHGVANLRDLQAKSPRPKHKAFNAYEPGYRSATSAPDNVHHVERQPSWPVATTTLAGGADRRNVAGTSGRFRVAWVLHGRIVNARKPLESCGNVLRCVATQERRPLGPCVSLRL